MSTGLFTPNAIGVSQINAVGSSPNSAAGTITNDTLVLQPASSTQPGVVSTTTQVFAGDKQFNGTVTLSQLLQVNSNVTWQNTDDSTTTGANANMATHATFYMRLTNASLTSLAYINNQTISTGHNILVHNITGAAITVVNNGGSAPANSVKIITGYGGNIIVPNGGAVYFVYDGTSTVWRVDAGNYSVDLSNSSMVNGALALVNGGTGATTKAPAFDALSPMTTAGDLIYGGTSGTGTRLANGTASQILMSAGGALAPVWVTAPTSSLEIVNLGIVTSVAASALTIRVKQADASTDATSLNPVKMGMRSSTLTSGVYNERTLTAALSMVVSSGSTLGQTDAQPSTVFIYLIDNAGTLELAVSHTLFREDTLVTTTAEGGAGAADSATVMYSTTARTSVPFRLIGKLINTQTTAGTWASAGTQIQLAPFQTVQVPTVQKFTTGSSTYNTPAGCNYIIVEMVGGGGGASGGGTVSAANGSNGNDTTFGSVLTAAKGSLGTFQAAGGAGGACTINSPALQIVSKTGGTGGYYQFASIATVQVVGGYGGSTPLETIGGAGGGGAGLSGTANSGAGGAGGWASGVNAYSGSGGGGGGYLRAIIFNPLSSYAVVIGAGGGGGALGTGGQNGGAGASGYVVVTEFYG